MPINNKKLIKRELEKSKFTTVQLNILHDKRLSPNGLRILISLLSDSENFNVSYKLFENRFGISNKTVRAAFNNLEACGYVKRTKLKRGFHYTISEFGNLKPAEIKDSSTEVDVNIDNTLQEQIDKSRGLLNEYLTSISSFLEHDTIYNTVIDNVCTHTDSNNVLDFYAFRNQTEKFLKDVKSSLYKALMDYTNKRSANISKKADVEYKEWLKAELYTTNKIPSDAECKKKWTYIKMRHQVFKTDYETAAYDKAEEDYYDNQ